MHIINRNWKYRFNKGVLLVALVIGCLSLAIFLAIQVKKTVITRSAEYQAETFGKQVILIDPGHGGKDGGAIAADGTVEKEINLAVSLPLADMLRIMGYSVKMTRDTDCMLSDIGLKTIREQKISDTKNRLSMYNESRLVLSIHQNHFSQSQYYGIQIFYGLENTESVQVAKTIREVMLSLLQPENKREIKKATSDIYLLHHTTVPAILVECGFLSNAAELTKLKDSEYQQEMAYAITCGVLQYNP